MTRVMMSAMTSAAGRGAARYLRARRTPRDFRYG